LEPSYFTINFFVPLGGRSGATVPYDFVIGALSSIVVIHLALVPVSYLYRLHNNHWKNIKIILILLLILSVGFVAYLDNPFTSERPKRAFIQHVEKINYDGKIESYVVINTLDYQNTAKLRKYVEHYSPKPGKCQGIYCEYPFPMPLKKFFVPEKILILDTPTVSSDFMRAKITVLEKNYNPDTDIKRVHINIEGNCRMNIYLSKDLPLLSWSFKSIPKSNEDYFIYYSSGFTNTSNFPFWLEVKGNIDVKIAIAQQYLEGKTKELNEILSLLPKWVDPIPWVSIWTGIVV